MVQGRFLCPPKLGRKIGEINSVCWCFVFEVLFLSEQAADHLLAGNLP